MHKFIQKRVYDVLSHRYGLVSVAIGCVVCVVAAFFFGEAVMEWSQEKYHAVFNFDRDNIAGKSFRNRLCPPLPIDVVYTWVNGSDPQLIAGLQLYKSKMENQLQINKSTKCTFSNCVPVRVLILEPALPDHITRDKFAQLVPYFPKLTSLMTLEYTNIHENFTMLTFMTETQVKTAINLTLRLFGQDYRTRRAYITSDSTIQPGTILHDQVMMSGFPHRYDAIELKERLPQRFWNAITNVDLYSEEGLVVFNFNNLTLSTELVQDKNITIDGKSPTFTFPNLITHLSPLLDDDSTKLSRFEDNESLKYSMRSVDMYAPWVRNVYLVTNGQIPSWLNLENERLIIVTHNEIFQDPTHLPSYSSPAIESHLHRIPGLSEHFLYFNDDVFLGSEVWPDDFYSNTHGYKVYMSWAVPNCEPGCVSTWINDGYCDKACNNSKCDWDGGDCGKDKLRAGIAGFGSVRDQYQFGQDNGYLASQSYCHSGCADNWLSDKYCDHMCNHRECAYDAGDCGTDHYHHLHSVTLEWDRHYYFLPKGTTVTYFNLTSILTTNGSITEALFKHNPTIRTAAVSLKFRILTLLLHPGHNMTKLQFSLSGNRGAEVDVKFVFNFTVTVSTISLVSNTNLDVIRTTAKSNVTHERMSPKTTTETPILFNNIPDDLRFPKAKRKEYILNPADSIPANFSEALPPHLKLKWTALFTEFHNGDLTEKGLHVQQQIIVNEFNKLNISTNLKNISENLHTSKHIRNLSINVNDISPNIESASHISDNLHHAKRFLLPKNENISTNIGDTIRQLNRKLLSVSDDLKYESDLFTMMIVDKNSDINENGRFSQSKYGVGYESGLPWERKGVFAEIEKRMGATNQYSSTHHKSRRLLDIFSDSLIFVNRLYNKKFGFQARKVPAHISHFINKSTMELLQAEFPEEWAETSSHQIRHSSDMQFAFSYFYYLMSVQVNTTVDDVFSQIDLDKSGVLSDREIRTLATQVYESPLDLKSLTQLEQMFINCHKNATRTPTIAEDVMEKYYVKDMPQVTKDLFSNCEPVCNLVGSKFKTRNKYKYQTENDQELAFYRIESNVSIVVGQLDDIRRHKKKFICLNDNMDHSSPESHTTQAVITDFLEAMYPRLSQFELPRDYRNRFLHVDELREWQVYRDRLRFWAHIALVILVVVTCVSFFGDKLEKYLQRITRNSHLRPLSTQREIVDV